MTSSERDHVGDDRVIVRSSGRRSGCRAPCRCPPAGGTARSRARARCGGRPPTSCPAGRPGSPAGATCSRSRWPNVSISASSSSTVWRWSASIIAAHRLNASLVTSLRRSSGDRSSSSSVAWTRAWVTSSTKLVTTASRARADTGGRLPTVVDDRGWPVRARASLAAVTQQPTPVPELARRAKAATRVLATASTTLKDAALLAAADLLEARAADMLAANARRRRCGRGHGYGCPASSTVCGCTDGRIAGMAGGLRQVASLPDPVGEVPTGGCAPTACRSHGCGCRWASWRSSTRADRT